jgi:hypothetical protein
MLTLAGRRSRRWHDRILLGKHLSSSSSIRHFSKKKKGFDAMGINNTIESTVTQPILKAVARQYTIIQGEKELADDIVIYSNIDPSHV